MSKSKPLTLLDKETMDKYKEKVMYELDSRLKDIIKPLKETNKMKDKTKTVEAAPVSNVEGIELRETSGMIVASPVNKMGIIETIPPKIYTLSMDDQGNKFFNIVKDEFKLPKTILGETNSYLERIVTSIEDAAQGSVGVLLTGLAGSGKSLLAEVISNHCIKTYNMPVLTIDMKLPTSFIKDCMRIAGPCVVYFDELGKLYDIQDQGKLLNLFSDSEFKDNVYIVCDNVRGTLNQYFFDRPGRFLYHVEYNGLSLELVIDFLDESKVTGVLRDYIMEYVSHYKNKLTFDILRTIVKFAKKSRSPEELEDVIKLLNVPNPPITKYRILSITKGDEVVDAPNYSLDYNTLLGDFTLMLYKEKQTLKFTLVDEGVVATPQSNNDTHYTVTLGDYTLVLKSYRTTPNMWQSVTDSERVAQQPDPYDNGTTFGDQRQSRSNRTRLFDEDF